MLGEIITAYASRSQSKKDTMCVQVRHSVDYPKAIYCYALNTRSNGLMIGMRQILGF